MSVKEKLAQAGPALDWVMRICGTASLVVAISLYAGQREYVQCQAAVNNALITAQVARAGAGEQDRDAMDRLVSDVTKATSPADSRAALARYQQTRAAADADRAANPLPAPPSQTCG